jgi:hypothetical protein
VYFKYAVESHLPQLAKSSLLARSGFSARAAGIAALKLCDEKTFSSGDKTVESRFFRILLKDAGDKSLPELNLKTGSFVFVIPFLNDFRLVTGHKELSHIGNRST